MTETTRRARVLIVDDERESRRTLRRLLASDESLEVVGETWGSRTPASIAETRPDIVFLDIEMPRMNGFDVLEEIEPDRMPVIVFVTAYDAHAVRAFDVRAIDYVLKPFTDRRLAESVRRAKASLDARELDAFRHQIRGLLAGRGRPADGSEDTAAGPAGGTDGTRSGDAFPARAGDADAAGGETEALSDRLVLQDGGHTVLLRRTEIDWIEAVGSYVRVHAGERAHLVRDTLTALETTLEPEGFFRIHRSSLVNVNKVRELKHASHGDYLVILEDGTRLKLSRTRREALERKLGLGL